MNKLVMVLSIIACGVVDLAYAQDDTFKSCALAKENNIVIGFFNGVLTTKDEAYQNLYALEKMYGDKFGDQPIAIKYQLFYNDTQGRLDFIEVFEQRTAEQRSILKDKFEFMWDLSRGKLWKKLNDAKVAGAEQLRKELIDRAKKIAITKLKKLIDESKTITMSPQFLEPDLNTEENYRTHNALIDKYLDDETANHKLLFVAHSQGNLFMHKAFQYAKTKRNDNTNNYVKAVHVAPASVILNGPHVLADKDWVIYGLHATGGVPEETDFIPPYSEREPGANGETDRLGHSFLAIYLNKHLTTLYSITKHINNGLFGFEKAFVTER